LYHPGKRHIRQGENRHSVHRTFVSMSKK
jgi:hypothetical protein